MPRKTAKLKPIEQFPTKGVVRLSKNEPKNAPAKGVTITGKQKDG